MAILRARRISTGAEGDCCPRGALLKPQPNCPSLDFYVRMKTVREIVARSVVDPIRHPLCDVCETSSAPCLHSLGP